MLRSESVAQAAAAFDRRRLVPGENSVLLASHGLAVGRHREDRSSHGPLTQP